MRREPEDFSPDLLKDALDAVRADDDATRVPARVQRSVMREWDARPAQRQRRRVTSVWLGAVAASLIAAIVLSRPSIATVLHLPWADTDALPFEAVGADLPFTEVALDDDRASMQYVQVRMPQSALADFGLPVADPADNQAVVVEVLVGLDGMPRLLRVLSREAP
jgi:hypothetical protein